MWESKVKVKCDKCGNQMILVNSGQGLGSGMRNYRVYECPDCEHTIVEVG